MMRVTAIPSRSISMVYPEAPFQLGPHFRVVRHEDFLQCLNCIRITGKVRGEYNFAYLTRQACRKLKKRKQKKRRTGFGVADTGGTSSAPTTSQGGALGDAAAAAAVAAVEFVSGNRHTRGQASGEPAPPFSPRSVWPIFWQRQRAPD
eukprot:6366847-Amphidinium_carterae.1